MDVLSFFEWFDGTLLADVAKAYGGVFAVVQMFHLIALALLGGSVLVSDLRLLGVLMTNVSSNVVVEQTHRLFNVALAVIIASGIFMSAAVAMKLYYNEMYWAKMAGLAIGIIFVYAIKMPLLRQNHETLANSTVKAVAAASIVIWFSVAACGRWIGFS